MILSCCLLTLLLVGRFLSELENPSLGILGFSPKLCYFVVVDFLQAPLVQLTLLVPQRHLDLQKNLKGEPVTPFLPC